MRRNSEELEGPMPKDPTGEEDAGRSAAGNGPGAHSELGWHHVPHETPEPLADHISLRSVCIPALIGAGVNAYVLWNEHWEHWSHLPPLEERVEYPYQNIRVGFSSSSLMICAEY